VAALIFLRQPLTHLEQVRVCLEGVLAVSCTGAVNNMHQCEKVWCQLQTFTKRCSVLAWHLYKNSVVDFCVHMCDLCPTAVTHVVIDTAMQCHCG